MNVVHDNPWREFTVSSLVTGVTRLYEILSKLLKIDIITLSPNISHQTPGKAVGSVETLHPTLVFQSL